MMAFSWFRTPAKALPPAPPDHFPPEFVRTFTWLVSTLGDRATADCAVELEAATMLIEGMRDATPDWPVERYLALAEIMRGLRA